MLRTLVPSRVSAHHHGAPYRHALLALASRSFSSKTRQAPNRTKQPPPRRHTTHTATNDTHVESPSSVDHTQRFSRVSILLSTLSSGGRIASGAVVELTKHAANARQWSQVAPLWDEIFFKHSSLTHGLNESSIFLTPFTSQQVSSLFLSSFHLKDPIFVTTLYTHLVRTQLKLTHLPNFVEGGDGEKVSHSVYTGNVDSMKSGVHTSDLSSSEGIFASSCDSSDLPTPRTLHSLTAAMKAFFALKEPTLALMVYKDLLHAIDVYGLPALTQSSPSSLASHDPSSPPSKSTSNSSSLTSDGEPDRPWRLADLPITDLIQQLRSTQQHQAVLHLYASLKGEWFTSLRHWYVILRQHSSLPPSALLGPPPPAPNFPHGNVIESVIDSMILTSAQNQRRVLKHFIQMNREQTYVLKQLITLKAEEEVSIESLIDQGTAAALMPDESDYTDSLEYEPTNDSTTQPTSSTTSDDSYPSSPSSSSFRVNSKYRLFHSSLYILLGDWCRWRSMTFVTSLKYFPDTLTNELDLSITTPEGRSLFNALRMIQFDTSMNRIDLSGTILRQITRGMLNSFPLGPKMSQPWWTNLYNRSIDSSFAEPIEETDIETKIRLLSMSADTQSDDDSFRPTDYRLPLDQHTWTLGFRIYLRFATSYSHSLGRLMTHAASKPNERSNQILQKQSPFVVLRHLLASKFAHSYATSLDAHPIERHDASPESLPGTSLSFVDWYTFWSTIDTLQHEIGVTVGHTLTTTLHDGDGDDGHIDTLSVHQRPNGHPLQSSPSTARTAKMIYERLARRYLEAAYEEAQRRGIIQIIRPTKKKTSSSASTSSSSSSSDKIRFLLHLPSSMFPHPRDSQSSIHPWLRLGTRCLQEFILHETRSSSSSTSSTMPGVEFILVLGCRSSTRVPQTTTEKLFPATPLETSTWRSQMIKIVETSMLQQFRLTTSSSSSLTTDSNLLASIRHHPHDHGLVDYHLLTIDSKRLSKWFTNGFVSLAYPGLDLPPNASAVESRTFKLPNSYVGETPVQHQQQGESTTTQKIQPFYRTQTYYLSDGSSFIAGHQHQSPFFDVNADLHEQEEEWMQILQILKDQGQDKAAAAAAAAASTEESIQT